MKVVVTGASGNVGTAVLRALGADPAIESITGIARRTPSSATDKVTWKAADITSEALEPLFEGADAVVHLAWAIQPSRDEAKLADINVHGSRRVFEAAAGAGVKSIVYASSVGAYSPGPKDREVDESWPTDGVETSFYARHKAEVEAELDRFEARNSQVRVVRLRPALIFSHRAAVGIRRLFLGPLFPGWLAAPQRIPVVPDIERLRFQAVHSDDVGNAFRLALLSDNAGAFNLAADPVLDPAELAQLLDARRVRVAPGVLRAAALATWKARLQPTPPGWLDMGLGVPLMSSARARTELGWSPRFTAREALLDLLSGLREGDGHPTPPLNPETSGPVRWREVASGVGGRPGL
jgi:nucleoside-diphosphate-sugar epimerase